MNNRCCHHRAWPDRHPAAAVTAGLFALVFVSMMLSTHPVASAALIGMAGIAGVAWLADRERARREACAARADAAYRRELESLRVVYDRGMRSATVRPTRPARPAPWHLVSLLPTEPLRAEKN